MNEEYSRRFFSKTTRLLWRARILTCVTALLFLICLHPSLAQGQKPQPSPTPRRPLPKLSNGARGFDVRKEKDSASRLIAVGGGWGGGESSKPRLRQKSAVGYYKLGQQYLNELEFFKAIAPLGKAVKLNPDYLAAYNALGTAYSYYGVTTGYDPTAPDSETPENDPAVAKLRDARYRKAIEAFEQARRLAPNKPEFHLDLGVLYFNTGQYQKALDSFEQGLRVRPPRWEVNVPILESSDLAYVYQLLGDTYEVLGKDQDAIITYRKSIEAKSDYPNRASSLKLAAMHTKLGQIEDAIKIYERLLSEAMARDPKEIYEHGDLLLLLGSGYVSKQDYASAQIAFDTAVKVFDYQLNKQKGWLAESTPEGRQSILDEVTLQQNYLAQANYNAGVAQLSSNQPAKALVSFQHVIELEPGNTNALFNLGYAYVALGNKEAAREELRILKALDAALADELLTLIEH
jgi:tetratricopeptide (TPR) repeat protein